MNRITISIFNEEEDVPFIELTRPFFFEPGDGTRTLKQLVNEFMESEETRTGLNLVDVAMWEKRGFVRTEVDTCVMDELYHDKLLHHAFCDLVLEEVRKYVFEAMLESAEARLDYILTDPDTGEGHLFQITVSEDTPEIGTVPEIIMNELRGKPVFKHTWACVNVHTPNCLIERVKEIKQLTEAFFTQVGIKPTIAIAEEK